jgi:hypothetical protein
VAAGHGYGVAPVPIARLRYVKTSGVWSLYWRDGNLRFHVFDLVAPTASIQELLAELDRDPTAIFRGRVMVHLMQYAVAHWITVIPNFGRIRPTMRTAGLRASEDSNG